MKNIIGAKPSPAAAEVRFLTVDGESAGQRLDNFLFRQLKGVPKTHVYRIIRSGEVRVNKGRAQAETRVEAVLQKAREQRLSGALSSLPVATPPQPAKPTAWARLPLLHLDPRLIAVSVTKKY